MDFKGLGERRKKKKVDIKRDREGWREKQRQRNIEKLRWKLLGFRFRIGVCFSQQLVVEQISCVRLFLDVRVQVGVVLGGVCILFGVRGGV